MATKLLDNTAWQPVLALLDMGMLPEPPTLVAILGAESADVVSLDNIRGGIIRSPASSIDYALRITRLVRTLTHAPRPADFTWRSALDTRTIYGHGVPHFEQYMALVRAGVSLLAHDHRPHAAITCFESAHQLRRHAWTGWRHAEAERLPPDLSDAGIAFWLNLAHAAAAACDMEAAPAVPPAPLEQSYAEYHAPPIAPRTVSMAIHAGHCAERAAYLVRYCLQGRYVLPPGLADAMDALATTLYRTMLWARAVHGHYNMSVRQDPAETLLVFVCANKLHKHGDSRVSEAAISRLTRALKLGHGLPLLEKFKQLRAHGETRNARPRALASYRPALEKLT